MHYFPPPPLPPAPGAYAKLLAEMRSANDVAVGVSPLRFKLAIAKFAPQFAGYNQHDCQVRV